MPKRTKKKSRKRRHPLFSDRDPALKPFAELDRAARKFVKRSRGVMPVFHDGRPPQLNTYREQFPADAFPSDGRPPTTLAVTVSSVTLRTLERLVETGLHGATVEQCAEELLREQLRKVLVQRREAGLDA